MKTYIHGAILVLVIIVTSQVAMAYEDHWGFEINANPDVVGLQLGYTWEETDSRVLTQVSSGFLYNGDEYTLGNAMFSLGNRSLFGESEKLRLDIGFKGLFGTFETDPKDADVGALGVLISFMFDIREEEMNFPLDMEFYIDFSWAPNPLCFSDLDSYSDLKTYLGIHVLDKGQGIITIGYRTLSARLTDEFEKAKKRDNAFFVGYKFYW